MLEIAGGIILALLILPFVVAILISPAFWGLLGLLGSALFGFLAALALAQGIAAFWIFAPLFLVSFLIFLAAIKAARESAW